MPSKHTALITGASSGIGLELAKLFAAGGHDVVLLSRSHDKLTEFARVLEADYGIDARPLAKDLAAPGAAEDIVRELEETGTHVDILVNNAGFTVHGKFAETDGKEESGLLQVNIVALTQLTKLLLPAMIRKGGGGVLNVASTAAFQPGPLMACYYASKAYVLSFTEALHEELRGTGVTATALCPGMTRTGFQDRAGIHGIFLLKYNVMEAHKVAQAGYDGFRRGKAVVVPGLINQLQVQLLRISPRWLTRRIVRALQSKPGKRE